MSSSQIAKFRDLEVSGFVITELYGFIQKDSSVRYVREPVAMDPVFRATKEGYDAALEALETSAMLYGMQGCRVEDDNVTCVARIVGDPEPLDNNARRLFELHRMFEDTPAARKTLKDTPLIKLEK